MTRLLFFLLAMTMCTGCIRTYRSEHASFSNTGVNLDGSVSHVSHSEGAEREWRGFSLHP